MSDDLSGDMLAPSWPNLVSSDSEYVSNILTLPSIICADKRSGGCKILSRYFSKMLSIPRYRTYRPILNCNCTSHGLFKRINMGFGVISQYLCVILQGLCGPKVNEGLFQSIYGSLNISSCSKIQ